MSIDTKIREDIIAKFKNNFNDKISKDIENSIYKFSVEYAETNDTIFLIQNIYEEKANDIISQINNQESCYLLNAIKDGTVKADEIAFLTPEKLNPEKYEKVIKKREMEEYKKNNKTGSNVFTCVKCKKANCEITQKQTRAGDEPPTTFVSCLECGHTFRMN